jgi:hypothetical protein
MDAHAGANVGRIDSNSNSNPEPYARATESFGDPF